MQLWKKNFLFTFIIFQVLIFIGLSIFWLMGFNQELKNEVSLFEQLIRTSDFLIDDIDSEIGNREAREFINQSQNEFTFYFDVNERNKSIFSSIPQSLLQKEQVEYEQIILIKDRKKRLLTNIKRVPAETGLLTVTYVKDLSSTYQKQNRRMLLSYLLGLLFTFLISLLIYWQMKKIYRPIQNISHELRTPLTLIKGYSEILLRIKVNEEKKMMISSQIIDETKRLQEIIEQLLVMGHLKEGEVVKEELLLSECLIKYQENYPELIIEVHEEQKIYANKVLIMRLLDNLLSNAFRESCEVIIKINQKKIRIINKEASISKKKLQKINRGKSLSPQEYSGSGQGLKICREIVQLHEGKINIFSSQNEVTVEIDFI